MTRKGSTRVGCFFFFQKKNHIKSRATQEGVQRSEAHTCDIILSSSGNVENGIAMTIMLKLSLAWVPIYRAGVEGSRLIGQWAITQSLSTIKKYIEMIHILIVICECR